jgi:hypothetical protein
MPSQRSDFSQLLAPGIFDVINQNLDIKQYPEEYSMIFNMESSTKQYEEETLVAGFGSMPSKAERSAIEYDDPIQGNKQRYTHTTYALGFRVSEELWEDELYGVIKAMPKELAFSARDVVEVTAAGVFINGFTDSAAYVGADGEPLFGDGTTKTHPLLAGGNGSNQLSVAADLNGDSFELALNAIEDTVNDRGLLVRLMAKTLVVPTELRWVAQELLESKQKPFVSTNEMNPYETLDVDWAVWHYLTDPDAWFILAQNHHLNFFWRVKPSPANSDDFDTGDAKFKLRQRNSLGYTEWRGAFGSPGA